MTTQSASKSELPRACRLCLANNGQLYLIFGGGIDDLAEKIYDLTALELEDINGIPSEICELCRSQVLVSHQFVLQCRLSDWKYKKQLVTAQPNRQENKSPRLNTDSSSSGIGELAVDKAGPSAAVATVSTKPVGAIPLEHNALKNDDRASRRHSFDKVRKVAAKKPPKRHLSDSSQHEKATTATSKVERDVNEREGKDRRKKQCSTCGNHVIHLRSHVLYMHSDVPKHVCPICGKAFKHKQYFNGHVNTHNGISPYKCKLCDKSYSYQKSFYQHMISHQERYQCSVCNAGFTHAKIMREHLLIHNEQK